MAFDDHLAARVREQLSPEPGLAEKAMFGGVAFLLDGVAFARSLPPKG